MILYLSSTQHTNLLDFTGRYDPDSDMPIKKLVGSYLLKQFVVHDMRNFSHFTDVVLARLAFGDDDSEFAEAIELPKGTALIGVLSQSGKLRLRGEGMQTVIGEGDVLVLARSIG